MKPIFKYSGGKTRELKIINEIISGIKFDRVIEPFAGGAAFSFDKEKPSLVSDIRSNNVDVYKDSYNVNYISINGSSNSSSYTSCHHCSVSALTSHSMLSHI